MKENTKPELVMISASYLNAIENELNELYVRYTGTEDAWVEIDKCTIDRTGYTEGFDEDGYDYTFNIRAGESSDYNDYDGEYVVSPFLCRTSHDVALFIFALMVADVGKKERI